MNVITSFISHSVQPGTSFAATPTLNVFKELYSIATRLVARVPQQTSQKMKSLHEIDEHAHSDFILSPGVQLAPDESLDSDFKTQTTSLLVSSPFLQLFP